MQFWRSTHTKLIANRLQVHSPLSLTDLHLTDIRKQQTKSGAANSGRKSRSIWMQLWQHWTRTLFPLAGRQLLCYTCLWLLHICPLFFNVPVCSFVLIFLHFLYHVVRRECRKVQKGQFNSSTNAQVDQKPHWTCKALMTQNKFRRPP